MAYETALAILMFCWFSGYVIGYKVRQLTDAIAAA